MSNINSYGTSIPQFQIEDSILHPKGRKVKHAICYTDEDIITLAFDAATKCLKNSLSAQGDGTAIDAIIFATTTPIFKDRYHASFLADMLGLPQGILALDLGTTNRSGTDALFLADTLIKSEKHSNILVIASDIKFPPIGKEVRTPFGHAAVALVISKDKGIAEITKATSYSSAIAEEFFYKGEKVQYDARFARTAGFKDNMKKVFDDLDSSAIDNLIVNSAYVKLVFGSLEKAGFDLDKQLLNDTLVQQIGFTGSTHALLRLVEAIEKQSGKTVLVDYNNGSNVIIIDVKENTKPSVERLLGNRSEIKNYQDYLTLRKQGKFDGRGYQSSEMFSSEMIQEREKDGLLYLKGWECKGCGTVYYMKAARCNNCKETGFSEKQLSKTGTVYTLTGEHYFPCSFPPTNMIVIDLDGGGRMTVQQTDDMYQNEKTKLKIGDKVQLVLRKMMENDSKPNYFWKCKKV